MATSDTESGGVGAQLTVREEPDRNRWVAIAGADTVGALTW